MSTITESDIKNLTDLINRRFDEIKTDVNALKTDVNELKTNGVKMSEQIKNLEIGQGEIKGKLAALALHSQKIPDLAEKVGELKNWKQIGLTLIGATIGSVITYLVKTPNP